MSHVDPELLALLALGEEGGTAADRDHLDTCTDCRDELENLRRAVSVGRSTLDAGDLVEPDPRVWRAIEDELGRAPAPVVPLRRRRWVLPVTAAAAVLGLVAVGAGLWLGLRPATPEVVASATLDPFPGWGDAAGSAVVARDADGARAVDVTLTAPGSADGYREVWLISGDGTRLVSLGILRGSAGRFDIPDGLDLGVFDLVDVSEEQFDGDPEHSGDSIVRGQLTEV